MKAGVALFAVASVVAISCPSRKHKDAKMDTRKDMLTALADFKSARDAMVHADHADFPHHMRQFVKQLENNPLCTTAIAGIASFDVKSWWTAQTSSLDGRRHERLESLDLPADRDAQLLVLLHLARAFGSDEPKALSVDHFGQLFGKYKGSEGLDLAQSLVLRPLAEELTRRLREAAAMVSPDVRDLAGVPLSWIPAENETGVFLSHKSVDKDRVRKYKRALEELGFKPWLDEDAVAAGNVLHRALNEGIDSSCAAVFFVTPEFHDEGWLEVEVTRAVNRKVKRKNKFSIITLVIGDAKVPRSLEDYVWAKVDDDIDGLREIVRALPIELGAVRWKRKVAEE